MSDALHKRNIQALSEGLKREQARVSELEHKCASLSEQIDHMSIEIVNFKTQVQVFIASAYGKGPTV